MLLLVLLGISAVVAQPQPTEVVASNTIALGGGENYYDIYHLYKPWNHKTDFMEVHDGYVIIVRCNHVYPNSLAHSIPC